MARQHGTGGSRATAAAGPAAGADASGTPPALTGTPVLAGVRPVLVAALPLAAFGLGLAVAVLAGFAPAPRGWQVAAGVVAAGLVGFAAWVLIRPEGGAPGGGAPGGGAHKAEPAPRPSIPRASIPRASSVAAAAVLLSVVCWLRPGEPGQVLFALAQAGLGLLVHVLPVLPLLALLPLSRGTQPSGVLLAAAGLLHLARGSPGFEAGGYRHAGGLLGIAVATPLRAVFSAAVAIGLLVAVVCAAALFTAVHLYPRLGRHPATAALAVLVAAPLAASGAVHYLGYRHYLGVRGDRVVVVTGLAPHHHHRVADARVALAQVPAAMHPVLRSGLPVTGPADGLRVAAALADPARAAAAGFPDGGLTLRTGECFSFVGGTSGFRYAAACNGEHTGEVFYVGHLPFTVDPGAAVRDAAARGVCEKAYGGYLGVPFGASYQPMEPPIVAGAPGAPGTPGASGSWRPRPLVACLFGSVGPWPLKGSRTIAAQQQRLDWSPGAGCRVEADAGLRIVAERPGTRCVAPGRAVSLATTTPVRIDVEFAPIGRAAGGGRVGAACLDADAASGYYVTVGADGVLELVRQRGAERVRLATSATGGRTKAAPGPQTTATQLQVTCLPAGGAVQVAASAGKGRQLTHTDQDRPPARLTPRVVVEAAEAPVTADVQVFSAVLPAG